MPYDPISVSIQRELAAADPAIGALLALEAERQASTIELIATLSVQKVQALDSTGETGFLSSNFRWTQQAAHFSCLIQLSSTLILVDKCRCRIFFSKATW